MKRTVVKNRLGCLALVDIGFLLSVINLGLDRIKGVFGFSELTVCAMDGAARASL
jgi:hypothetical protein